ncbi:MAG: MarR family winged helix-turn-helix transcriptional regulator [Myxococcaceae bacterium]
MYLPTVVYVNYVEGVRLAEQIGRLSRASERRLTRMLAAETDRSFLELRALKAIERENVRTQAMLAERLLRDPPAVSRLVDRLEEDGLLRRQKGPDRRSVRLEVTAAGMKEIARVDAALDWLEKESASALTAAELKTLKGLLDKLLDTWCQLKKKGSAATPKSRR